MWEYNIKYTKCMKNQKSIPIGVVTENENIDESKSNPLACEVPLACVLTTCARFASGSTPASCP